MTECALVASHKLTSISDQPALHKAVHEVGCNYASVEPTPIRFSAILMAETTSMTLIIQYFCQGPGQNK